MRRSFILVIFVLIYSLLEPTPILAKSAPPDSAYSGYDFTISTPKYLPPGSDTSGDDCPVSCDAPSECANSHNDGNCGDPVCQGGDDWSKYSYQRCIVLGTDPDTKTGTCQPIYTQGSSICSIGDKCMAGDTGLRAGFCDCSYGASSYKYCCSSIGNAESCTTAGATQDNNDPSEGQCPGGYIVDGSRVRDSSCVPISGPPPPPPPPPPDPEVIPFCGDGICNNGEDTNSCPQDCGYPPPPPSCQFSGCGQPKN